ncbi:MAG: hypothetical protein ABS34_02050 [Opitutaceae bacterium BACL24 MAG-120322-bin51]|jgi:uncharacterized membrane protein YsdA (DUF1294 family)|nr:MAG: hypothetical protein ABS34_02050 [Opitutaceae bacterium BACL24 MAG-120322-bin51]
MHTHRLILVLLILPILALLKSCKWAQPRFALAYLLLISLVTYAAYWHDKRRAQAGASRVPEATLHFLEFSGGWPAAYLAQQQFRHKTIKRSYQMIYWSIVALYQYISLEILVQWRLVNGLLTLFR